MYYGIITQARAGGDPLSRAQRYVTARGHSLLLGRVSSWRPVAGFVSHVTFVPRGFVRCFGLFVAPRGFGLFVAPAAWRHVKVGALLLHGPQRLALPCVLPAICCERND